jgi:hypothetical protein
MHVLNASAGLKLRAQSTNPRAWLRRTRAALRLQARPYGEYDLLKAYFAGIVMAACGFLPFVVPALQHAFH